MHEVFVGGSNPPSCRPLARAFLGGFSSFELSLLFRDSPNVYTLTMENVYALMLQNLQVAWKTPTGIYGTVQNCIFANIFATVAFAKLWTLAHTSTGARKTPILGAEHLAYRSQWLLSREKGERES